MSTKKWLLSIVMIGLFSQSFLWTAMYKMQTLFEKGFDAEIEDVIFDSYEKDDAVKFYPKIVILKHLDEALSQGEYKFYKKEVKIYNSNGDVVSDLWFPFRSRIGCSNNGNYFYVWTVVREKPEPYNPAKVYETRIKESSFVVYNDKGEILWKIPFEPVYDADYSFRVSPRDGSVIELLSTYFDSHGKAKPIRPLCGYNDYEIYGFSKNWEHVVAIAYKYPEAHQSSIPGKSPEPRVLLLDSLLNLVWEKPLNEYNGYGAAISPKSTYTYASSYTTLYQETGIQQGYIASSTGCLLDRHGNLIMKIENGSYPIVFSENEHYLLTRFYTPNDKLFNEIGLIDISAKKTLFKKKFRTRSAFVAADGSVAILRRIRPETDREQLEKMPVREARKLVMQLEEKAKWKASLFDREGTTLLETDGFESMGRKIVYDILHWDGIRLVLGVKDNTQSIIRILSIELIGK